LIKIEYAKLHVSEWEGVMTTCAYTTIIMMSDRMERVSDSGE